MAAFGSLLRSMLTLPVIDFLRSTQPAKGPEGESLSMMGSFMDKIGVAMFSSTILSLVLYPFDTAKRCLQLNGVRGHIQPFNKQMDVFKIGLVPLYRGVHLYLIREFLTAFA